MPRGVLIAGALLVAGCGGGALPDPESRGAVVLRERCAGCHRLYLPGTLTVAMWRVQVERMQGEFARRGVPWLTAEEERALLEYLGAHAGTS